MRLKTSKHKNTIYLNLPKAYCDDHLLEAKEGEFVDIVIHRIVRDFSNEEDLIQLYKK